jgi:hypothetical protein
VASCSKCGDEPSRSCATELVSYFGKNGVGLCRQDLFGSGIIQ